MKYFRLLPIAAAAFLFGCVRPDQMAMQRALQEAIDHCNSERKLYMHGKAEITGSDIVVSGHCLPISVREDLEAEAAKLKNPKVLDFPDQTVITSDDNWSRYYFTKPGNPRYPWALAIYVAGKYAQPGVKADQPAHVVASLAIPKMVVPPYNITEATAVVAWANALIDDVRREFNLVPPAPPQTAK